MDIISGGAVSPLVECDCEAGQVFICLGIYYGACSCYSYVPCGVDNGIIPCPCDVAVNAIPR